MSELVSIITPTGSRPEAFALCQKYVSRQTYAGPIQWIVVNDSHFDLDVIKLPQNIERTVLEGPIKWQEGLNTQKLNLTLGLKHVKGKYLFFIEDDDSYSPKFIETMLWMLDRFAIVGEGNSKYYNLTVPGWKQMSNFQHSALSSTAMRIEALPHLQKAIAAQGLYIDIELWRNVRAAKLPSLLFCDKQLSIGIKGMPGRAGIGVGHTKTKDYLIDPAGAKLAEWIGADVVLYQPYLSTKFKTGAKDLNVQKNEVTSKAQSNAQKNGNARTRVGPGSGNTLAEKTKGEPQAQKPINAKG